MLRLSINNPIEILIIKTKNICFWLELFNMFCDPTHLNRCEQTRLVNGRKKEKKINVCNVILSYCIGLVDVYVIHNYIILKRQPNTNGYQIEPYLSYSLMCTNKVIYCIQCTKTQRKNTHFLWHLVQVGNSFIVLINRIQTKNL